MIRTFGKYLLFCSLAVLTACSGDLSDDAGRLPEGCSRIKLSLSAESAGMARVDWNDKDAVEGEMMKDALVVMVNNATGLVERIIPVDMAGGEYERHDVGYITVENGPYTFYSFANIPYTKDDDESGDCDRAVINGLTFQKPLPDSPGQPSVPEGLETSTWKADYNGMDLASSKKGIPMSNEEEYTIDNSMSITLHLFRMLSKVRFELTNKTKSKITLKKVVLGELTANGEAIYLLPPKNGQSVVNAFPGEVKNDSLTVYEPKDGGDGMISAGASLQLPAVYINESVSQHPTGQMPLHITMDRADGNGDVIERYALLQLSGIPRNAFVVVPVSLTDYVLELKAFFYPPIGGYPPYTIEQKETEFYCTFSGAGDFVLRPSVYRYEDRNNPEKWFDLNDRTKVSGYSLTVDDPAGIFSEQPAFAAAGEILGTLSGTPGKATVRLTANLLTDDSAVVQVFNRTIHIIAN